MIEAPYNEKTYNSFKSLRQTNGPFFNKNRRSIGELQQNNQGSQKFLPYS